MEGEWDPDLVSTPAAPAGRFRGRKGPFRHPAPDCEHGACSWIREWDGPADVCVEISVGKQGKEPGLAAETWGCGEELDVVPSCAGGGEGAPRVWHRQEEGEDERFRSRRRRRRFPCPGDADVVPGRWG